MYLAVSPMIREGLVAICSHGVLTAPTWPPRVARTLGGASTAQRRHRSAARASADLVVASRHRIEGNLPRMRTCSAMKSADFPHDFPKLAQPEFALHHQQAGPQMHGIRGAELVGGPSHPVSTWVPKPALLTDDGPRCPT